MTVSLKTVERLRKLADDQNALAARFVECKPEFYRYAKSAIAVRNLLAAMANELEIQLRKSNDIRTEANETPQA